MFDVNKDIDIRPWELSRLIVTGKEPHQQSLMIAEHDEGCDLQLVGNGKERQVALEAGDFDRIMHLRTPLGDCAMKGAGSVRRATGIVQRVRRHEGLGKRRLETNIALGSVIELQVRQPGRLIGDAKIQNAGVALDRGHVQPDAVDGTFLVTVKYVLERDAAMPAEGFGHTMKKPTSGRSRLLREIVRSHSWQTRFQ